MAAAPRSNPSTHTKSELGNRGAETVGVVGNLARTVVKSSNSPALKSTITAFADYERTIDSTGEMLRKINQGLADLDEAIDEAIVQTAKCATPLLIIATLFLAPHAHQLAMTIRSCPPYLRRLDPRPPDLKPDHPLEGNPSQPASPSASPAPQAMRTSSLPMGCAMTTVHTARAAS